MTTDREYTDMGICPKCLSQGFDGVCDRCGYIDTESADPNGYTDPAEGNTPTEFNV